MTGCIVGWAHGKFGRHDGVGLETLIVDAATEAIADAGIAPADVDEIYIGHFNGGFVKQDFPASLVLHAHPDLRFKPATRVENACATGSAAIHQGLAAVAAGKARFVLCVGVEKMTELAGAAIGEVLTRASYVEEEGGENGSFVDIFARIAESYFRKYGDRTDALARIAAKNHANGAANPLAHFQKDLGYDFCRRESEANPVVSGPLKRSDCSPVTDGAAALVLADAGSAMAMDKAVRFRSASQVNDFLPMSRRDVTLFEGPEKAWKLAFERAGMTVRDLDVAEVHDCFTIAELLYYEALGFCGRGEAARLLEDGETSLGGRIPVNPSGGLLSRGHPIGATGAAQIVEIVRQLRGRCGARQVEGARVGLTHCTGGGVSGFDHGACSIHIFAN